MPSQVAKEVSSSAPWLRSPEFLSPYRPESASHFVQFYGEDSFLVRNVAYLTSKALEIGESSVLIATRSHLNAIEKRLTEEGVDSDGLRKSGRYVALDAAETLARFLVNGEPDPLKFDHVVGATVRQAAERSGNGFVFAFGEMVALLYADQRAQASVRLEQMWNSLARKHRFSLYCAYPLVNFENNPDVNALLQICAEHALAIPAETFF
jgi:hypothetical protein